MKPGESWFLPPINISVTYWLFSKALAFFNASAAAASMNRTNENSPRVIIVDERLRSIFLSGPGRTATPCSVAGMYFRRPEAKDFF